jgi:hypothetical protein
LFSKLAADAEFVDDRAITSDICLCKVLQNSATATYEEQETTTVVVIMLVGL